MLIRAFSFGIPRVMVRIIVLHCIVIFFIFLNPGQGPGSLKIM